MGPSPQKTAQYCVAQSEEDAETFNTFDLGLAAALTTFGFHLLHLNRENPRKTQFVFKRQAGIEKSVHEYWSNELQTQARALIDNVRMLKNRLYSDNDFE